MTTNDCFKAQNRNVIHLDSMVWNEKGDSADHEADANKPMHQC